MKKLCSVSECEKQMVARGWCHSHYKKWRKYGDPLGVCKRQSPESRFSESYMPVTESGCWLWEKGTTRNGYGVFWLIDRLMRAHRAAWILFVGGIPDNKYVLHKCDVPSCVNPNHLFLGTQQDNIDDKVKKGRHLYGERHPSSILTDKQVREIRLSDKPQSYFVKKFKMSSACISRIKNHKRRVSV